MRKQPRIIRTGWRENNNLHFKIIEVTSQEMKVSIISACNKSDTIKERNRTISNYQYKFLVKR